MALGSCHTCIKYLMFAFNFLFWLLGCALLGVGIYILVDKSFDKLQGSDSSFGFISIGAYVIIAVGVLIMVIGFLGCCGAIRESQCMLALFFAFLFIIFCILLGIGIYCVVAKDEVRLTFLSLGFENVEEMDLEELKLIVRDTLRTKMEEACKAKPDPESKNFMATIQKEFDCCGAESFTEYSSICLKQGSLGIEPCTALSFDKKGCTDELYAFFADKALIIAGIAIGVAVILILGMIFSMVLCCAIRDISD